MPYPFPLIEKPEGDWRDPFEHMAIEMSYVHNVLIRGLNAIYAQAREVEGDKIKPFAFFCSSFVSRNCLRPGYFSTLIPLRFAMLHHHHGMEEKLIFPYLEARMGENAMSPNVDQHNLFMNGVKVFEEHMSAVHVGQIAYDGVQVVEKLDSFSEELVEHLREEIGTLEASKMRAALSEADLRELEKQISATLAKETPLTTVVPLILLCHNKSTEPDFPPLPAPVIWLAKYAFYYLHSDAWAFAPCDIYGTVKPGLGNVV
uniref:Hemerythrin-like domain-containing protein n=1 Tax=Mycena chlorophos TaxID=658473 RepID=A0ABQ0L5Z6_MYCCL|nr:predicted protein [Mycena chlorophos]